MEMLHLEMKQFIDTTERNLGSETDKQGIKHNGFSRNSQMVARSYYQKYIHYYRYWVIIVPPDIQTIQFTKQEEIIWNHNSRSRWKMIEDVEEQ